ncbi:hypothetical protein [Falsiroseomonas sp.]|nr:hypothetical protein [Falsiroseomonas sp.]MDO9502303.1 hypothetical protein [Falsiroseomonas sp.]
MSHHPEKSGIDRASFRHSKRGRNTALLAVLIGLAVLFYLITVIKMGGAE